MQTVQCGKREKRQRPSCRIHFLRRHYPDQVRGTGGCLLPHITAGNDFQRPCDIPFTCGDTYCIPMEPHCQGAGQKDEKAGRFLAVSPDSLQNVPDCPKFRRQATKCAVLTRRAGSGRKNSGVDEWDKMVYHNGCNRFVTLFRISVNGCVCLEKPETGGTFREADRKRPREY